MHKMKGLVILFLTILEANAYYNPQQYPFPSQSPKSHRSSTLQTKERGPTQVFNPETRNKPYYAANADVRQRSSQRPLSETVERDRNNQQHPENNREKYPVLLFDGSRKQYLESELRKPNDDSSYPIKYSVNKESDNNDRSYEDSYPALQSQSAYHDNTPKSRSNFQLQSRVPQNTEQSQTVYAERSNIKNSNVRHDSGESNESSREYPRYYEKNEEVNKRSMHYSQHAADHQQEKPYSDDRYQKASHQNQPKPLTTAGTNVNHANSNKRNNEHQMQQYDLERETSNTHPPSKRPPQYQQRDNIPTHSNYKEERDSDESPLTPLNKYDDLMPLQPNFSPSGQSDFRPSGYSHASATDDSDSPASHHTRNTPTRPHEPKSKQYHQSSDYSNTPVTYNSKDLPPHLHNLNSKHYSKSSSDSNTDSSHKRQNMPTHLHEPKLNQYHQYAHDQHTYQNHETEYHEQPMQDPRDQHDSVQMQQKPREPTSHTEALNHREWSRHRDQVRHGQPMNNQQELPVHQQRSNAMRVVESKKDMKPLPSEVDSNLSEEHDGFLDMGAYTDKRGSFGWYADFPVGKEHDKVTYSFSK